MTSEAAAPAAFTVTHVAKIDRQVLLLAGDLDLAAAEAFEASCGASVADGRPVVIDCSALTFIDCCGIRRVLRALENPQVRLANVPAHMLRVLRITGLSHILDDPNATRVFHGCDLDPRSAMVCSTEERK